MTTLTYRQARWIVMGFGTALIAGVALSAYLRGADLVEVGAIGLFLPVLYAFGFGRTRAGVAAGILVSALYLVVRFMTLPEELDATEFVGSAIVRVLLYVGLGLFGGWANEMLEHSLLKLELYDEVDDDTGVGNARAMLHLTDRELSRSRRYGTVFSLSVLHLDRSLFDDVSERRSVRALRDLAQTIEHSARTTDLVSRVPLPAREDLVTVLPETGREGARTFTDRLVPGARDLLTRTGVPANGEITGTVLTFPEDAEQFEQYHAEIRAAADTGHLAVEPGEDEAG